MNFTLHQLRVFLSISRTSSITKSAEELHLSQPAVSIQLRQLQQQFEYPLTELVRRRVHITEFGREIAASAERILMEAEQLDLKSHRQQGDVSGSLRLAIVSTAQYILPPFLYAFGQKYPGIQLTVDVTNKTGVALSLERNEVDVAMVSVVPRGLSLEATDLMSNKLFVVASEKIIPKRNRREAAAIANMPFIFRERGSGTRLIMEQFVKRHRISPRNKLELSSNEAVKQAVIAGLGCAIMPIVSMKNELQNSQIRIIPFADFPIVSMWRLIWLRSKKFSIAADAFVRFITNEKAQIIEREFSWTKKFG